MSNQAQLGLTSELSRVQPDQQTSSHLIFVDPGAEDVEQRMQEVLLIRTMLKFDLYQLRADDMVGQISSVLDRVRPGSIRSMWIIAGREIGDSAIVNQVENSVADLPQTTRSKARPKLDKRIAAWKVAFSDDATCYLLGDQTESLAEHIDRLTGAEIRFDIDALPQVIFDEVVFVDPAINNFEPLVQDILLNGDAEVILLDSERDGMVQVFGCLAERKRLKTIHLICPGAEGALILGNGLLNRQTLQSNYRAGLSTIQESLNCDGEIRIYSSQFHAGDRGHDMVRDLSLATNAFIVVASAKSVGLTFSPEIFERFTPSTWLPAETPEWHQKFSPLPQSNEVGLSAVGDFTSAEQELGFESTKVVFQYEFDRAQSIGWLCIGFVFGAACSLAWTVFG